jgi:hypothetical protein
MGEIDVRKEWLMFVTATSFDYPVVPTTHGGSR